MDEEILKRLEDHERRLRKLEGALAPEGRTAGPKGKQYKGLVGGIRLLKDNGFFNQPKNVDEVKSELEKEGYYYTFEGVASTLSERFLKGERVLTRHKENDKWRYVVRK